MSTSPEAKQAAGEWGKSGFSQRERDIFAEGYDAATAKLREDVFNAVFRRGTENGNETWEQILQAIRELSEAMKQLHEADEQLAAGESMLRNCKPL